MTTLLSRENMEYVEMNKQNNNSQINYLGLVTPKIDQFRTVKYLLKLTDNGTPYFPLKLRLS